MLRIAHFPGASKKLFGQVNMMVKCSSSVFVCIKKLGKVNFSLREEECVITQWSEQVVGRVVKGHALEYVH